MTKISTLSNVFPVTKKLPDDRKFTVEGPSEESLNFILAYSRALQVLRTPSGRHFLAILN